MKFYMKYSNGKNENEIFGIRVTNRSNSLAIAEIDLSVEKIDDMKNIYNERVEIFACDNENTTKLFCGKTANFIKENKNGIITIRAIAKIENFQMLDEILENFKKSEMYSENLDLGDIKEQVINNQPYSYYYDDKNNQIKLTSIIDIKNPKKISSEMYFQDSMRIRHINSRISNINVSIEAQWVQSSDGDINLYHMIAAKFKNGIINSLTDISKNWLNIEKSLSKSSYKIMEFYLRQIAAPGKGMACSNLVETQDGQKVLFKRFWYDGALKLYWSYSQKYKEYAKFSIKNTTFPYHETSEHQKNISVKIPIKHIQDNSIKSFFSTNDGKIAIRNFASQAFSALLAAERNIEVKITGDFKYLNKITIDDTVELTDKQFQVGKFIGKVVEKNTNISGNSRICTLRMLGTNRDLRNFDYTQFMGTINKKLEKNEDNKLHLSIDDIVKSIEIINPPEYQNESIQRNTHQNIAELRRRLSSIATGFKVNLNQLTSSKYVEKISDLGRIDL